jgi:transposase
MRGRAIEASRSHSASRVLGSCWGRAESRSGLRGRPTGFGLYRHLAAGGIRCEVVAPSNLQKPAGDRVKTDAKDAVHLPRLLRLDEITPVSIPTVGQETARDLVRAREDCRGDLMRARHRLLELLLRHGTVY